MNYEHKYLKYKSKYLALKGGADLGLTKLELEKELITGLYYPVTMCAKGLCHNDTKHTAFHKISRFENIDGGRELKVVLESGLDTINFGLVDEKLCNKSLFGKYTCKTDTKYRARLVIEDVEGSNPPKKYEPENTAKQTLKIKVLRRVL